MTLTAPRLFASTLLLGALFVAWLLFSGDRNSQLPTGSTAVIPLDALTLHTGEQLAVDGQRSLAPPSLSIANPPRGQAEMLAIVDASEPADPFANAINLPLAPNKPASMVASQAYIIGQDDVPEAGLMIAPQLPGATANIDSLEFQWVSDTAWLSTYSVNNDGVHMLVIARADMAPGDHVIQLVENQRYGIGKLRFLLRIE